MIPRMIPEGPATEERVSRVDASDREGNQANRRLRVVLLLSFGGLLIFLFYSGASALQTLRQLHEVEESARRKSLERERVLTTVIISTNIYSDHMEEFLLSSQQPEEDATSEVSKQAEAARSALQSYPVDRSPEEQALIQQLETYLVEQDSLISSSKAWKPEERQSRAQQVIHEEIIPRRREFVAIAQKVELLNDGQTVAAEQGGFVQFDYLQNRLMRMLILEAGPLYQQLDRNDEEAQANVKRLKKNVQRTLEEERTMASLTSQPMLQ